MTELSADEQSYLLDAFAASPHEWFLPRGIDRNKFSDRTIDKIVESLERAGLMDGQTGCYARLTDQGRKTAAHLGRIARRDWPRFHRRRRVRVAVATIAAGVSILLVILKVRGVL